MSDYTNRSWLKNRIKTILAFYYPTCVDEEHGGFIAQLHEETGDIYDADSKHLVAATRFVANFSLGHREGLFDWCASAAKDGADFLQNHFRDDERGGYHWLLDGRTPVDSKRMCYGHAFALLAHARAHESGIDNAEEWLDETYELHIDRFFEEDHGLCRSEYDADWEHAEPYRGQNGNMHTCESMLVAFEATGEQRYLDRAQDIAHGICVRLADRTDGRLWEHYTEDWDHDFDYNRNKPKDLFRPWGFMTGHQAEWAKLLCILSRHADTDWALPRARELFDITIEHGWDDAFGGLFSTFDRDGEPIVTDKYGWAMAEAIGAAAALYERTRDEQYLNWYNKMWSYSEENISAPHGNWFERVDREGEPYDVNEGPAVEPGYHPIGACLEGLEAF